MCVRILCAFVSREPIHKIRVNLKECRDDSAKSIGTRCSICGQKSSNMHNPCPLPISFYMGYTYYDLHAHPLPYML